jgi:hypothetical protein
MPEFHNPDGTTFFVTEKELPFLSQMTEAELRRYWRLAFDDARCPLARDIHLQVHLPECDLALRQWMRHPRYLRNLIAGGQRIDVRGRPVEQITQEERYQAYDQLIDLKCQRQVAWEPREDWEREEYLRPWPRKPKGYDAWARKQRGGTR